MDQAPVELLERARCGDPDALTALISLWGDTTMRIAWLLSGDRDAAERLARETWLACWAEMPSLHTERPFRPWLLSTLLELARERGVSTPEILGPVEDDDVRIAAALRFGTGLKIGEIAMAGIWSLREARVRVAAAEASVEPASVTAALKGIEFPDGARVRPSEREPLARVERETSVDAAAAWGTLASPAGLSSLTGAPLAGRRIAEGITLRGTGRLGPSNRTRDEVTVTIVRAPERLAWCTRAKPRAARTPLEIRFAASVTPAGGGARLTYDLLGIAKAPGAWHGFLGRGDLVERIGDGMHRGLERLAALASGALRL